jgi:hypothetical protein
MFKTRTRNKRILKKFKNLRKEWFAVSSHIYSLEAEYNGHFEDMCEFDYNEWKESVALRDRLDARMDYMINKYGLSEYCG